MVRGDRDAGLLNDHAYATGRLDVGDGHELWWQEWGNPDADRVFLWLHGGPGAATNERHASLFDPSAHHVVFFDQRGAGRSTPFASTDHNTTDDLVRDIERVREARSFDSWIVAGRSWGSTLALAYAIEHPDRVDALALASVFLAREQDMAFLVGGPPTTVFPEAWARFIALVPEPERDDWRSITDFYVAQMRSDDTAHAQRYADEWTLWEASTLRIEYDQADRESEIIGDPDNLAIGRLETHYMANGCWMPEGYILSRIDRVRDIPCRVVHGRWDMCTSVSGAFDLQRAYGENCRLEVVTAGHYATEEAMLEAVRRGHRELGAPG